MELKLEPIGTVTDVRITDKEIVIDVVLNKKYTYKEKELKCNGKQI